VVVSKVAVRADLEGSLLRDFNVSEKPVLFVVNSR